eukprot:TRINITY_DN264_c0_g1_i1.p1 TRINITY_DN264_c0_g1~~TRINITY_DN264_c0_g1_i1.p1  ORF type:complete len:367 (-),score=108.30 TRINITY_DN264_c0_g1_i1:105-1172(-)
MATLLLGCKPPVSGFLLSADSVNFTATRGTVLLGLRSQAFRGVHAHSLSRSGLWKSRVNASAVAAGTTGLVEQLQQQFGQAEGVSFDQGEGGLPRVTLTHSSGSVAEVYLYGAVTTSWKLPSGEDLLFVRPDAVFTGKKPISGGIPHCFPQFGPGEIQQHGFARNVDWEVVAADGGESGPSVTLQLLPSDYTTAMWPHSFRALFKIALGEKQLSTELQIENTDTQPFSFTAALHSYFRAAIAGVKVRGLKGLKFLNKDPDPTNPIPGVEEREEVTFPGFIDCMYLNGPDSLNFDNGLGATVKITNLNWTDVVVWNPYLTMEACYKNFVCVENAQLEKVSLAPGEIWTATQTLTPQ